MIAVIDFGLGNLGSIFNMLKKIGVPAVITRQEEDIVNAKKIILPGVGSFDKGMENLEQFGLIDILKKQVLVEKKAILGICLGMQLMTESSEEGQLPGLAFIKAKTKKFIFPPDVQLKIPNMGWKQINIRGDKRCEIFANIGERPRFYFVHSYHVWCEDLEDVLATAVYGYEFVCAFQRENMVGVQFHPEKSHKFGLNMLKNFVSL